MNTGFGIAGIVSPIIFGPLIDVTCVYAEEAVRTLTAHGRRARRLEDGSPNGHRPACPSYPDCSDSRCGYGLTLGWTFGWVSYMRIATARPEAMVIAAAAQMAERSPHRSAVTPPTIAPAAYPLSRQRR